MPIAAIFLGIILISFENQKIDAICIGALPEEEFAALEDLYYTTNGPKWQMPANCPSWSFPSANRSSPCIQYTPWCGLTCNVLTDPSNGSQCTVVGLSLDFTMLSGPIPNSIGNLSGLNYLDLGYNSLFGSIPENMPALLTYLFLENNYLTGEVPTSVLQLTELEMASLSGNQFSGKLLEHSTLLPTALIVTGNLFSGSIFPQLVFDEDFESLFVDVNYFTGELPPFGIGQNWVSEQQFCNIVSIQVSYNLLSGDLPESIGNCTRLALLMVSNNEFTGSLPELRTLTGMTFLDISSNSFSGGVSSSLFLLPQLIFIYANDNKFSGPLPDSVSLDLQYISLSNNVLSGTISSAFGRVTKLVSLAISNNRFSGSFPSFLTQTTIEQLIFNSNMFYGELPASILTLTNLQALQLSQNLFDGNLQTIFRDSSTFQFLGAVHLDDNAFTGSLPGEIFLLSQLSSISMCSNCFDATLPTELCQATNLKQLILDGLSNSRSCEVSLAPGLSRVVKGHFAKHLMEGSLPSCLWQLPQLEMLHAAGNGLTGKIPESTLSAPLTHVSVARNKLSGILPESFQDVIGALSQLDLSENRFSGTLNPFLVVNQSLFLNLTVNRFSGNIPATLLTTPHVNILNGNLFQCSDNARPRSDPERSGYICGSENFNNTLILWSTLFAVFLLLPLTILLSTNYHSCFTSLSCIESTINRMLEQLQSWLLAVREIRNRDSEIPESLKFLSFLDKAMKAVLTVTLLAILVALPSYLLMKLIPALSRNSSTHQFSYTWVTTAAFLHGVSPTVVTCVLSCLCTLIAHQFLVPTEFYSTMRLASSIPWEFCARFAWTCKAVFFHLMNAFVVLLVNAGYVTAVLSSNPNLMAIQFGLSCFKLFWALVYVPYAVSFLEAPFNRNVIRHELFMRIFNVVLAPMLATAMTDSTCFLNLFLPPVDIVTSYVETVNVRNPFTGDSFQTNPVLLSIAPPWIYSNQCASALITNYTPVLLIVYSISGAIVPFLLFTTALIPFESVQKSNILQCWVRRVDILWLDGLNDKYHRLSGIEMQEMPLKISEQPFLRSKFLFRSQRMVAVMLQHFTILLTFGLASPLLAGAVMLTVVTEETLWQLLLGRYLVSIDDASDFTALQRLEQATRNVWSGPGECFITMSCVVGLFWGLLSFDMISDVEAGYRGLVAAIGVFLSTPLSVMALRVYQIHIVSTKR